VFCYGIIILSGIAIMTGDVKVEELLELEIELAKKILALKERKKEMAH
jgi:hypothetical protein